MNENQTQNRRAVIDVGSNSVKLLVAEVTSGDVTPLVHEGEQTRLGRGVFDSGKLDPEAIAQTAFVAGRFAEKARRMGAVEVKAVATSAAREARNGMDLIEAFRDVNVPLTIIEGAREAELVLRGVRSHSDFSDGPLAIIDVGGGSTELLVADETGLRVQHSFPLGTVRLLEQHRPSDLPTAQERAKAEEEKKRKQLEVQRKAEEEKAPERVVPLNDSRLNLNTAPPELIAKRLPGVGYATAKRIVELRMSLSGERFSNLKQLENIPRVNWEQLIAEDLIFIA